MDYSPASLQLPAKEYDELVRLLPQMKAFARSLSRDPVQADDLTQEAFVRAWRQRDSFTPGTNMRAWVFTIIRNLFFSEFNRSRRVSQLDPKFAEETLVAVSDPTASLELDDLRRAMQDLSVEHRQALNLVSVEGLTYYEAAVICRCAEGTMKSRISRAREALVALMAKGKFKGERRAPALAMNAIFADAQRASASGGRRAVYKC